MSTLCHRHRKESTAFWLGLLSERAEIVPPKAESIAAVEVVGIQPVSAVLAVVAPSRMVVPHGTGLQARAPITGSHVVALIFGHFLLAPHGGLPHLDALENIGLVVERLHDSVSVLAVETLDAVVRELLSGIALQHDLALRLECGFEIVVPRHATICTEFGEELALLLLQNAIGGCVKLEAGCVGTGLRPPFVMADDNDISAYLDFLALESFEIGLRE